MNRRDLLGAAIAGASLAMASAEVFAAEEEHEHAGHNLATGGTAKLAEAAAHCLGTGNICISHCIRTLAAGDASLAACTKSVYQMTAICDALARLAAANSSYLPAFAKIAHAACLDCEKECRKHENGQPNARLAPKAAQPVPKSARRYPLEALGRLTCPQSLWFCCPGTGPPYQGGEGASKRLSLSGRAKSRPWLTEMTIIP